MMLADDLAQDTFIRAWQGLKGFRGVSNFETWLLRIAYRVFLDEHSKATTLPLEGEQGGVQGASLLRYDLDLALSTLSEAERTCVVLQCVEGQSIKEIMQITGMNENTVKSHLFRGKKHLADFLRKNGYGSLT